MDHPGNEPGTVADPDDALLQNLMIPISCTAAWDDMAGNERVRYCGLCRKDVHNLSAMPKAEAAALLAGNVDGTLCVRFYRRGDGTVVTGDASTSAPVRVRRMLGKVPRAATAVAVAHAPAEHHVMMGAPPPMQASAGEAPAPDRPAQPGARPGRSIRNAS